MGRPRVPLPWWTCQECGSVFQRRVYGRPAKFCDKSCSGRATMRQLPDMTGPSNPRYNFGLCFHRGRWLISCRDGSTMQFARGVMCAEIGRLLQSEEIVHHINGDPTDDRLENLQIVTRSEHARIHSESLIEARLVRGAA